MSRASITYRRVDGSPCVVEYDTNDPCGWSGLPVVAASTSGTTCCPWCDLGVCRFDREHRVDGEGFDPATGKMYPPRRHYEREHADRLSSPPEPIRV